MVGVFVDDRLEEVSAVFADILQFTWTEEFAEFLEFGLGLFGGKIFGFWVLFLRLDVLERFHLGAFHCETGDVNLSTDEVADVSAAVAERGHLKEVHEWGSVTATDIVSFESIEV